ncbi:unnamed protein product [Linum trigynum]|uniref:PB1-like domain-containing protein n=1 Tax=Linum trigynum TaxID=586398 RepID=A0AAV2D742_9ROSI
MRILFSFFLGFKDDKFTIELHYKDEIVHINDEDISYFGGEVVYLDWIDPDCLSLFELDGYVVDIGHMDSMRMVEEYRTTHGWAYYWRLPGERLKEGLQELTSDSDILDMAAKIVLETKFVEVYLINKDELRKCTLEAYQGERPSVQSLVDMGAEQQHENGPDYGHETNDERVEGDLELLAAENYEGEEDVEGQTNDMENESHDIYIDSTFDVNVDDELYDSDNLGSVHSDEEEGVQTRSRYP